MIRGEQFQHPRAGAAPGKVGKRPAVGADDHRRLRKILLWVGGIRRIDDLESGCHEEATDFGLVAHRPSIAGPRHEQSSIGSRWSHRPALLNEARQPAGEIAPRPGKRRQVERLRPDNGRFAQPCELLLRDPQPVEELPRVGRRRRRTIDPVHRLHPDPRGLEEMKTTETVEDEVAEVLVAEIARQRHGNARHRFALAPRGGQTELVDMAAIPRMVRKEGAVGAEHPAVDPLEEGPVELEHARFGEDRVEPVAKIDVHRPMAGMRRPHIGRGGIDAPPAAEPAGSHLRRREPCRRGHGPRRQITPEKVGDPRLEAGDQIRPQADRLFHCRTPHFVGESSEELRERHMPRLLEKPREAGVVPGAVVPLVGEIGAATHHAPFVFEDQQRGRSQRHRREDGVQSGGDDEPGGGQSLEHHLCGAKPLPGASLAAHERRMMARARAPGLRHADNPRKDAVDGIGAGFTRLAGRVAEPADVG